MSQERDPQFVDEIRQGQEAADKELARKGDLALGNPLTPNPYSEFFGLNWRRPVVDSKGRTLLKKRDDERLMADADAILAQMQQHQGRQSIDPHSSAS